MWRFVLCDTSGNQIAGLTAATSRKVVWALDDACTASFTLPGTHAQAQQIEETETDLLVYDEGGEPRFRGRLGSSTDDVSSTGHVCNFSAVDYRGFLQRRIIWPGSTTVFTSEEQTAVAWQLIADTQAQTAGDLGISDHSIPTGNLITVTYDEGTNIGQTVASIGDVDNGFDWEIDPLLRFNTYFPNRGADPGITLAYGPQIASFTRTFDSSTFATAIRYSGDSTSTTPETKEASSFGPAGRWELQTGDTTITDQVFLDGKATRSLTTSEVLDPSYQVILNPKFGWTPDVLWIGDTATLVLKSGRLNVVGMFRANTIEVDEGDDGGIVTTITFGDPVNNSPLVYDPRAIQRAVLARLIALENK